MAKHIDTDTVDGVTRDWYAIDGEGEFAITSDDKILDSDGVPLTEGDTQTQAVRRAIEAARRT